jgi:UDP-2,3-diacylglucosamine hydrolase
MKIGENSRFILLGEWIMTFSYGVFNGKNFELKQFNNLNTDLQVD